MNSTLLTTPLDTLPLSVHTSLYALEGITRCFLRPSTEQGPQWKVAGPPLHLPLYSGKYAWQWKIAGLLFTFLCSLCVVFWICFIIFLFYIWLGLDLHSLIFSIIHWLGLGPPFTFLSSLFSNFFIISKFYLSYFPFIGAGPSFTLIGAGPSFNV